MERQTKNAVVAGIAGIAIGALAGILMAPAKGSETRAAISGKATDLKDKAVELKDQLVNKVSNIDHPMDLISNLKEKIDKNLTNGKTEVKNELIGQIKELEAALKKA